MSYMKISPDSTERHFSSVRSRSQVREKDSFSSQPILSINIVHKVSVPNTHIYIIIHNNTVHSTLVAIISCLPPAFPGRVCA